MGWEVHKRYDHLVDNRKPFISLTTQHFHFNRKFTKMINQHMKHPYPQYATIYIDEKEKRIGFKFFAKRESGDCYKFMNLSSDRNSSGNKRLTGKHISSRSLVRRYEWVNEAIQESETYRKRFDVFYDEENKLWYIELERKEESQ